MPDDEMVWNNTIWCGPVLRHRVRADGGNRGSGPVARSRKNRRRANEVSRGDAPKLAEGAGVETRTHFFDELGAVRGDTRSGRGLRGCGESHVTARCAAVNGEQGSRDDNPGHANGGAWEESVTDLVQFAPANARDRDRAAHRLYTFHHFFSGTTNVPSHQSRGGRKESQK